MGTQLASVQILLEYLENGDHIITACLGNVSRIRKVYYLENRAAIRLSGSLIRYVKQRGFIELLHPSLDEVDPGQRYVISEAGKQWLCHRQQRNKI